MMVDKLFMENHGYTFKRNLGDGVYGKVVSAHSSQLRKLVAIKVIDKRKVNTEFLQKFLPREMEILGSLKHPNIVRTYNSFEHRTGKVYIPMEFCLNGDLLNQINVNQGLSEQSSCRFFKQLCAGIQYLHNSDVAHRDIKCENLLLDKYYNLKVCDFGFSKRLTYINGRMVLSKTFCGTSTYAAPEVLQHVPYNPKVSDVWSMGVVLYMMLYVSAPYDCTNITRMVKTQKQHNIIFPDIPSVSSEAKDLIRSILHPDVKHRITISNIHENPWMQHGTLSESDEASASNADSPEGGAPNEVAEDDEKSCGDDSDPGEGPSTAAPQC